MREAQVVRVPTRFMLSLMASGTPASGGSGLPAARSASTRAAASSASSGATCRNAWTPPSRASMAARETWGHLGGGIVAGGNACGDLGGGKGIEALRHYSLSPSPKMDGTRK